MPFGAKDGNVSAAVRDLRERTLSQFARPLDRLIYLASTRDYNSGIYFHDGLASIYGEDAASQALAQCHREAFRTMLETTLRDLVEQIEAYVRSVHLTTDLFIAAWKKLEPYRVTVPVESDPLAVEFFFANLRTALVILGSRPSARSSAGASA